MTPLPLGSTPVERPDLSDEEDAIARSVRYAALFDYPLTLAQLRQTLISSRQTPSAILATLHRSHALSALVEHQDGFFFPAGRKDLIDTRRRREARSRSFLAAHRFLLRLIAALPYVRLVALSGSIAHLNLEAGGDLDLFVVTRGRHVWSTAVIAIVLARLLGRRRSLCANFVVADSALVFDPPDLFTASQLIGLKPLTGDRMFRQIIAANPFVRRYFPNFHVECASSLRIRQSMPLRAAKRLTELVLWWPSALFEVVCREAYRRYLRRRSTTWESPGQVRLDDARLKLHTRSHRARVMRQFRAAVSDVVDEQQTINP